MPISLSDIPIFELRQRIRRAKELDTAKLEASQVGTRIKRIMDRYSTRLAELMLNGTYRARKNRGAEPFNPGKI